jgi:uncharacterized membrane protein YdbT with pleckstrin-like domain
VVVSNEKVRLEPTKKIAPQIVGVLVAMLYLVVPVSLIIGIYDTVKGNSESAIWFFACVIFVILILQVLNHIFSWTKTSFMYEKGKKIIYEEYSIITGLDSSKTTYTITSISSIKDKKDGVIIRGEIKQKETIGKAKDIKKLKIPYCNSEGKELLSKVAVKC